MPKDQAGLAKLVERDGISARIVRAFMEVAREDFVPEAARKRAYADRPIPILEHQTTSQPTLIARMIDAADPLPGDRILEIGTGFGFQTALLARLGGDIISVERHPSLARAANDNLARAGITSVRVVVGDGWLGWPDEAPYDAIIVSAGAPEVPKSFAGQLKEGGRLVIPVAKGRAEEVVLFVKSSDHLVRARVLTPARFVPLVKGAAETQSNE